MPRYFFNVQDKTQYKDEIGVNLPDLKCAKEEALHHFGETLQSYASFFADGALWQISVTDDGGNELMKFSFFMHQRT